MDARLLALQHARALRPLDAHFADLLLRHAARPSPHLALAAALVSRHAGEGHVCLPLERFAGRVAEDVLAVPGVDAVTVVVRKLRPPVPEDLATSAVRIHRTT